MSRWSKVRGEVVVQKERRVSLNKVADYLFDDYQIHIDTEDGQGYWLHKYEVVYSEEGTRAFETATFWLQELTELGCVCNNSYIEVAW